MRWYCDKLGWNWRLFSWFALFSCISGFTCSSFINPPHYYYLLTYLYVGSPISESVLMPSLFRQEVSPTCLTNNFVPGRTGEEEEEDEGWWIVVLAVRRGFAAHGREQASEASKQASMSKRGHFDNSLIGWWISSSVLLLGGLFFWLWLSCLTVPYFCVVCLLTYQSLTHLSAIHYM